MIIAIDLLSLDLNRLMQSVLDYIQNFVSHDLVREWVKIERLYEEFGFDEYLPMFAEKAWQEVGTNLRNEGVSQLLREYYEFGDLGFLEFTEQFTQEMLDPDWEWVDPLNKFCYTIEDNKYLQINVSSGHDLSNCNAPRLLRNISGDFIIETMITDGNSNSKHGGLLIWKNEQNFIRLETSTHSSYWPNTIYSGANVNGRFIHPGVPPLSTKSAWLRIKRKGDRFTAYVSTDGNEWYSCGWLDVHVDDPVKVGIYAQCTGALSSSTRFEYFKIYRPK